MCIGPPEPKNQPRGACQPKAHVLLILGGFKLNIGCWVARGAHLALSVYTLVHFVPALCSI